MFATRALSSSHLDCCGAAVRDRASGRDRYARESPGASSRSTCASTSSFCGWRSRRTSRRLPGCPAIRRTRTWRSSVPASRSITGSRKRSSHSNPDLVIAGIYTARTAVAMLKRVGIPVLEIGIPKSLDDVRRANPRNRRADRRAREGRKRDRRHGPTPRGAAAPVVSANGRAPSCSIRTARPSGRERWSTRS